MFKYLKTAFLNRWNLLLFGGGMAFATLSGRPDVFGSLVMAAELAYLGFLGTNETFQNYVNVTGSRGNSQSDRVQAQQVSKKILGELPKKDVDRFDEVRTRCEELRRLGQQLQGSGRATQPGALDEFQIEGLDRLLWVYLKMLYSRYSVAKFLKQTSPSGIQRDIDESESRLRALDGRPDDPMMQRRKKLLEENLQMSKNRLMNYKKSEENFEIMGLELERLENTIHSLSELAVTRSEPKALADQIDQMADSMVQTEKAIGDLQFATGLEALDDAVPQLLRSDVIFER
ncbi:MAG: hypothetical protein NT069_03120 [Planctomycetota bacterium]|nr:hypothetical protein [Planctomycetota bacterium]